MFDSGYKAKHDETKGTGLKILTPKQMLLVEILNLKLQ